MKGESGGKKVNSQKPKPAKSGTKNPIESGTDQLALPWWVELLFVQIGLPDSLLRSFLKGRKNLKRFVQENQRPIGISLIGIVTLIYAYPVIRQARLHNQCLINAKKNLELIENDSRIKPFFNKEIMASNICNGGKVIQFNNQ